MRPRRVRDGVLSLGAVDWNRRLFDSLMPLPHGTSYNAFLVEGSEKIALLDTVEPAWEDLFLQQLAEVDHIDYLVSHHSEQDHSGLIPTILEAYPEAVVVCSPLAKSLLTDHLDIADERIQTVGDGETLSLGDKTLRFLKTPWVHWPETIVSYLVEDRMLFSGDLFGSHLATSNLYASSEPRVLEGAKRYYAELMMAFRKILVKNLQKIRTLEIDLIAPTHGPIYDQPEQILSAYEDWASDRVSNQVVMPYVTMHGSTQAMVDHLTATLVERGIEVKPFELTTTDSGELGMALVDAATMVIGTPTVLGGPHPVAFSATHLVRTLRPKARYAAIIGSYGWGTKVVEQISDLISNLEAEMLSTVLCKGYPREEAFTALDALADAIQEKHAAL